MRFTLHFSAPLLFIPSTMPTVQFTWHIGISSSSWHHYNTISCTKHKISGAVGRLDSKFLYNVPKSLSSHNYFPLILGTIPRGQQRDIYIWSDIYEGSEDYSGAQSQVKAQWGRVMMGLRHFTLFCLSLFQLAKLSPPSL